jgi:hypothetical protein
MGENRLHRGFKDPFISPRFRVSAWTRLVLADKNAKAWKKAVDIFLDRIEGRFLAPVAAIRHHSEHSIAGFSGFCIIAIDCLLIETLVQFSRGEDETSGWHGDAFAEFFLKSKHFAREFDSRKKCLVFYSHFRCGILHQAQTKKRSLVRYGLPTMVQPTIEGNVDQGLIIDRELFHDALLLEISDYANQLRDPKSEAAAELRGNFIKKMGFIVRDLVKPEEVQVAA